MLIEAQAPPDVLKAVSHAIGDRSNEYASLTSSPSMRFPETAEVARRSLSFPHRIAYLSLGHIRRGGNLGDKARMGAWRYLVLEERKPPAVIKAGDLVKEVDHVAIAAATAVATADGSHEIGEISEGRLVTDTQAAAYVFEDIKPVSEGRYEPFLLLVPTLYVAALWFKDLRNDRGDSDWMVPMPGSDPMLTPFKPFGSAEFFALLRRLAAKVRPKMATI